MKMDGVRMARGSRPAPGAQKRRWVGRPSSSTLGTSSPWDAVLVPSAGWMLQRWVRMRHEVTSLHRDTCRGDISAWMWPPHSDRASFGHLWSMLPQDLPPNSTSLWAVPSGGGGRTRSLLGAGRPVGHQRCKNAFGGAARVPSPLQPPRQRARLGGTPQPRCRNRGWERAASLAGLFPPHLSASLLTSILVKIANFLPEQKVT